MDVVALKEWAVAVQALGTGAQIVVLRKGGIHEETKRFELKRPSFLLYPTYEHQRAALLKEAAQPLLEQTLTEWDAGIGDVTIRCFAEAVADIEVTTQEQLDRIRDHHIWTDSFAEERLRWKKLQPLHVLLLRVYKLDHPLHVPFHASYKGCTSWMTLQGDVTVGGMTPVLSDAAFAETKADIERLLTF